MGIICVLFFETMSRVLVSDPESVCIYGHTHIHKILDHIIYLYMIYTFMIYMIYMYICIQMLGFMQLCYIPAAPPRHPYSGVAAQCLGKLREMGGNGGVCNHQAGAEYVAHDVYSIICT